MVGTAVNVTALPEQIELELADIRTDGKIVELITLTAALPLSQPLSVWLT